MENEEFATIDVDVTPDDQNQMVDMFVVSTLRPESVSVFDADLAAGRSTEDALYHAVFNEMVIRLLVEQIERVKTTDPQGD